MKEVLYEKVFNSYRTVLHKDTNDFPVKTNYEDEVFGVVIKDDPKNYHPKYRKFVQTETHLEESVYLENYGNPLATVLMERLIIIIEKNEGKTVFKIFSYMLTREVGKVYFKKSTSLRYFGFNEKDGSIYYGRMVNYHKKRKCAKTMRKNIFYTSPFNEFKALLRNQIRSYLSDVKIYTKEPEIVTDTVNQMVNIFLSKLPFKEPIVHATFDEAMYKLYLDNSGVKYPNNWKVFRTAYPAPTKKFLKKNGYKFIDTFMMMNKLNGDKVKRALHKISSPCDPQALKVAYEIFGNKFILSHDDELIVKILESGLSHIRYNVTDDDLALLQRRPKDKHNAFEIYKLCLSGDINNSTFTDHLRFYARLSRLENVRWDSNDYKSFMDEHILWTERFDHYDKGTFNRIYPKKFKDELETIILGKEQPLYPKLLINTKEYNEESFIQSNCVKTYIKREMSVIVSLRRGEEESKDRATIEYRILHDGEKVCELKRVQTLGRFNNSLDDTWMTPLTTLDERISKLVTDGLFGLPEAILEVGNDKIYTKLMADKSSLFMSYNDIGTYRNLKWSEEINIKTNDSIYLQGLGDELPFI